MNYKIKFLYFRSPNKIAGDFIDITDAQRFALAVARLYRISYWIDSVGESNRPEDGHRTQFQPDFDFQVIEDCDLEKVVYSSYDDPEYLKLPTSEDLVFLANFGDLIRKLGMVHGSEKMADLMIYGYEVATFDYLETSKFCAKDAVIFVSAKKQIIVCDCGSSPFHEITKSEFMSFIGSDKIRMSSKKGLDRFLKDFP